MELFSHAEARLGVYMDAALDVKGTRGCSAAEKGSFEEIDTRSLALVRDMDPMFGEVERCCGRWPWGKKQRTWS